jgi:hypothetical protein
MIDTFEDLVWYYRGRHSVFRLQQYPTTAELQELLSGDRLIEYKQAGWLLLVCAFRASTKELVWLYRFTGIDQFVARSGQMGNNFTFCSDLLRALREGNIGYTFEIDVDPIAALDQFAAMLLIKLPEEKV